MGRVAYRGPPTLSTSEARMAVASVVPALDRVPPNSIEAERAVLGAILLNNEVLIHATELVREDDFYRSGHAVLYKAMLSLEKRGEPIDIVTVVEELRAGNDLDKVGGASYVASLTNEVPSVAHARHYATIIRKLSTLRGLINTANDIASEGYQAGRDVEEFLDRAEKEIFQATSRQVKPSSNSLGELLKDAFAKIEELHKKKDMVTGVPSGFHELDELTAGFQPSDLIIVAGRPGMGKTSFVLNVTEHAAGKSGIGVAFFSLEMSKEQLTMRMLCSESLVDSQKLRRGRIADSDWPKLTRAAGVLSESPIFIDDTPAITTLELRAKARRLYAEHNIGLIVIDYMQLMRASGKYDVREQEISEISRSLKALAKELNIPIIALSQLNRSLESRSDKRPMISDLRESGAIEQDADVVMFVYRPEIYEKEKAELAGLAEIIVGKQRHGPTGTANLLFHGQHTKFVNVEKHYD